MGWIVSPTTKFTCGSPNPQYLRMWHYLETGTLQMELRWDHTGWRRLLIQYDCYAYKKERFGHRHTHTRRMPCEHQGGNEVMQLQAKGHQKVSANHQEPQERSGTDVPDSPQKEPPRRYLISNIPPPELWNNKFLLTTQIVVLCYRSLAN